MRKPLFCQTVTLYHAEPSTHTVTRMVLHGVFLQAGSRTESDPAGSRAQQMTFLVIPEESAGFGVDYTLASGDRVCRGEGAELDWEGWKNQSLTESGAWVVAYVTPFYEGDTLHHVEAGDWWTQAGSGAHSLTN